MGKLMSNPPKIFHVNWFRTDKDGKFLWPGFGENLRVLEWILDRCRNKVGAIRTPIGHIPHFFDIDMTGLELSSGALESLLEIDRKKWLEELKWVKRFFQELGKDLPLELWDEYNSLKDRFAPGA